MQAIKYVTDPVDILMRKRIEEKLREQLAGGIAESVIFDCHEFGLCFVRPDHREFVWFKTEKRGRLSKPRIVATVTSTDGVWKNFRRRWFFALSKLGYLYCVAYEAQAQTQKGGWRTTQAYRSWERVDLKYPLVSADDAVPEDWVFREAERLFKQRRRTKP